MMAQDILDVVYHDNNLIAEVQVTDSHIIVTTNDQRLIYVPMTWLPFLKNANEEQRKDFINMGSGIHWNQFDDGIGLSSILLGPYQVKEDEKQVDVQVEAQNS